MAQSRAETPADAAMSPGRKPRQEPEAGSEVRIGSKLKHGRLLKGLTLRELADVVGCSESMLSKLENDRLMPSISFLHRLASALDTSIAELYAEPDGDAHGVHHFPADRRARIFDNRDPANTGTWFERLIPVAKGGLLQANILNIPAGVKSDGLVEHVGEEFGYLISGQLDVQVDGKTYAMKEGDLLFFSSSLPHGYENRGSTVARILWVNTPPSL
ncbi:helix-turn-helix domain-containing protein [Aquibium microcysteis]|uniref:helix-turn-helix domain-containing protein n=1 Tax=Aquibium microcysteis TaxID=675281 RepID=UPI00165D11E6|nr:cupin domain-containing protein [Aquibium microcysteis]